MPTTEISKIDNTALKPPDVYELAFGQTVFKDDFLHAVLLLRDRLDRNVPPVAMTVVSLAGIKEMVVAAYDEVHYLVFDHKQVRAKVKLSYISRLRQFNIHFDKQNVMDKEFTANIFQKLATFPVPIIKAIREELDG